LRYNSNIPITRQTGLINCFSKETYQQVGGFDEEFIGWGAEDDAFVFKIRRVTGKRELRCKGGVVLHLGHKKVNDRSYLEGLRYKKNRAYCSLMRRMTDEEFKRYLSHETTLDDIYKDFAARGGIEGDATLIVGPRMRLNVNTSIYYVKTLTPTMTEFLTEVLAEDGPDMVKSFVNSYATEKDAYPEVLKEVEEFYEKHGITND
jgi:predicted glycosyltransferase involved in capsule biosynthesis